MVLAEVGDLVAMEEFHAAAVTVSLFVGDVGAVGHVAAQDVRLVAFLIADFSGVTADLHGPDAHLFPLIEGQFLDDLILDGRLGLVFEEFAGEDFAE
jgi:hypothetical protein